MRAVHQINLHHSKAATATLCQKKLADDIGVVLMTRAMGSQRQSDGTGHCKGKFIYSAGCDNPRACMYVGGNITSLNV